MTTDPVNITINGVALTVPAGEMVIESARRIGIEIPHFCYHPRLSKEAGANCRMCLVEVSSPRRNPDGSVTVAKMPKPQTSCSLPAAEGMVIETETPAIVEARRGILEFLLINHPLDCPICDRGGECPLQNNTLHYGPPTTRFAEDKRRLPKAYPLSEHVVLDRERCIHCARCTRFADDISGDAQLGFLKRGAEMEVGAHTGEAFTSLFSGNTIELCPVGALLSRRYRFRGRPWDLETQKSICTECSNGCNIKIDHRAGRLVRVNARLNEAVNEEWTCDRGKFGMEYVSAPERLTTPLIRKDGRFEPASWEEALNLVAGKLRDAGPQAAFVGGTRSTNEDLFVIQRLYRDVLGSGNLDHRMGPWYAGHASGYADRVPMSLTALEQVAAFVAFGADLAWEQPIAYLRVRKSWRLHGLRVVSIAARGPKEDDRPSRTAAFATSVLRHDPGRELEAAQLLLREVVALSGGQADLGAGAGALLGDRALTASSVGLTDEAVARAARVLVDAAAASAGRSVEIWVGDAVRRSPAGPDVLGVLDAVLTVTGNSGRTAVPATEVNEQGARDLGIIPDALPGGAEAIGDWRNTDRIMAGVASGEVGALWIASTDLVHRFHDGTPARRALENCPFLLVTTLAMDNTARMADVVLPVCSVAERSGTYTNVEGRVQRFLKAYDAPDGARPEWWIASMIAGALGKPMHFAGARDVLQAISEFVPLYQGCSPSSVGDEGVATRAVAAETPALQGPGNKATQG